MQPRFLVLIPLFAASALLGQEPPKPSPALAAFSPDGLRRIRDSAQTSISNKEFAGINVIIFQRGQVVMRESFGYQNLEEQKPLKADTIFRLFSLTKPVAASAAMVCFDDGKFQLDDAVAKYIPGFANVKVLADERGDGTNVVDLQPPATRPH